MNGAIITAMEEEIILLREKINAKLILSRAGCKIFFGKINNLDIFLLQSGIGKTSTAIGTTLLIEHFSPEFIINTGSAGGLTPTFGIGDIVVSTHICYHDVNITAFGYQLGQIAKCPPLFKANKKLLLLTKKCIKKLNLNAIYGLICSGDKFIHSIKEITYIRMAFPEAIAIEMEGAAVAHVCYKFGIPFIVVRAISDIVCEKSQFSFKKFLAIAVKQSTLLVKTILDNLAISKEIRKVN